MSVFDIGHLFDWTIASRSCCCASSSKRGPWWKRLPLADCEPLELFDTGPGAKIT